MLKVYIIFYTRYGNTLKLAEMIAEGVRSVNGCEAVLRRTAELAPEDIIKKDERWKKAREYLKTIPEAKASDLFDADAVIFGSPTRYGNMSSSLKDFIDKTAGVWVKGGLVGKVGAAFTSSTTIHGGQETTLLTMFIPMLHHGMIIAGIPYSEDKLFTTAAGGSPYGASSVTGPMADRPPTEEAEALAIALGKRVAELSMKLKLGEEAIKKQG
ncbi:MAG: NAD(P)H:quinone oxidoreductase [Candidatus Methanoperedens sp.]